MRILLIFTICFTAFAKRQPSICDYTQYKKCYDLLKRQSRSGNASYPMATSGSFTNPATINIDRGFGIEILDPDYGTQVGLVTGTGRVGAAVSNNPNDETFFGNIAIEDINSFRVRDVKKQMFESDKVALDLGTNILGKKSKN